jgi:hypothetical protein
VIKQVRQNRDNGQASKSRTPSLDPYVLGVLEGFLSLMYGSVDRESWEGPDRNVFIDVSVRELRRAYIEAMDWNVARFATTIPIRVCSEKWAASRGEEPRLWALYAS